ncbi:MAG: hypothetical protein M0Q95_17890 [Porticoccaceae bacterium]|nr:hypothetical protein [Porticoccaceae bacterium]
MGILLDELGNPILDESGNQIYDELGSTAVIINTNFGIETTIASLYSVPTEEVYLGFGNMFPKQMLAEGAPLTTSHMQAITRVGIIYNKVLYTSANHPAAFDWATLANHGVVVFRLGVIPLPPGRDRRTEVVLFAPSFFPNGVVWGTIDIKVTELGV